MKTIFSVLLFFCAVKADAQQELFLEDHDKKPYYFGITLSGGMARFQTEPSTYFLNQDSILVAEPVNSGSFGLGLLATGRINHRFEVRFNPQLLFTERNIYYRLRFNDRDYGNEVTKKVESVMLTFPLQVKFRSDRIGNFRVYMMGGGKVDYDLASNAQARQAEDMIKIGKTDYGIEGGVGFNFYFRSFIFSPELKISNGLKNMHTPNPALKFSNVLDRIQSRMIMFSIHLEG